MATAKKLLNRRWGAAPAVLLIAAFFRFYRIGDHPLGIFFDPAINGLDSLRLMQRGGYVLFFPTNGGRESLFMVLLMPFIGLFGSTPFALRALTAAISLLTVALLFAFLYNLRFTILDLRLSRSQFTINERGDTPLCSPACGPFLAALTLATMYWAISVSRLGQRPVLVPLLAVPIFWLFLKGWAADRTRWFILSGALLGLAVGYTYGAARLLPVILLLTVLPEFFIRAAGPQGRKDTRPQTDTPLTTHHPLPATRPSHFKNLLLLTATALLVYLPMAWYFAAHPAQFSARAGSVMVWNFLDSPAAIAAELGRNALRVAGFFCCAGSPNPIFGLPGYPGLSPWLAPFLLIGLSVTLANWRSLFYRLTALWWLIGIAPSIIAVEAPHPLRMIVALPATAILVALGLLHAVNWLSKRLFSPATRHPSPALRFTLYVLPLLLILLPLPGLYRAYFMGWTARQDVHGAYDYGAIAIRDAVLAQAGVAPDTPIYLPQSRFNDSTLLYYLGGSFARQATLSALPAVQAVVISPQKYGDDSSWVRLQNGIATVLPPFNAAGQAIIQAALTGQESQVISIPDSNESAALMAPLPADPALYVQGITHLAEAEFGPMQLTGANAPEIILPEEKLLVTLFWEATQPMRNEYEVLVRLVDDTRRPWGNGDARPTDWIYPTSFWQPGSDKIAAQHQVERQATLPPGRYWLAISLFDPATGQRLPLTVGATDSPDTFYLGPLKVPLPLPQTPLPLPELPLGTFGDVAQLVGYRLHQPTFAPGDVLQLELVWQAESSPVVDYTIFVHLLDEAGNLIAGHDSQPVGGSYPTSIWTPGEQVFDLHGLPLPQKLEPGQYRVAVGIYHQPTGQRLPFIEPTGQENLEGRLILPELLQTPF